VWPVDSAVGKANYFDSTSKSEEDSAKDTKHTDGGYCKTYI